MRKVASEHPFYVFIYMLIFYIYFGKFAQKDATVAAKIDFLINLKLSPAANRECNP